MGVLRKLFGAVVAAALTLLGGPSWAQSAPSLGTVTVTVFPGGLVNTPTAIMVEKGLLTK